MNPKVNAGKEGRHRCVCGRVWELSERKVPMRDKDSLACDCGATLVSWNGGCVWNATLIEDIQEPKKFIVIEFHHQEVAALDDADRFLVQRCAGLVKKQAMQKIVREIEGRETVTCQGEIFQVIRDTPQEFEVELTSGDRITVDKESEHVDVYLRGPEYEVAV